MYLKEIPDDKDLTDLESDDEDCTFNHSFSRNNFDEVFQKETESKCQSLFLFLLLTSIQNPLFVNISYFVTFTVRVPDDGSYDAAEETDLDISVDGDMNEVTNHPSATKSKTSKLLKQNVAVPKIQEPTRHWRKKEVSKSLPAYTGKTEGSM